MLPTIGRTAYLRAALESVLSQGLGPEQMQIGVVDNGGSGTGAAEAVRAVGDPRVTLYRQPGRVSMAANWNTCIARARGQWIHILHDDDMVLPGFYASYRTFIERHGCLDLVFCRARAIDADGIAGSLMHPPVGRSSSGLLEDAAYELAQASFICASAAVVRRGTYTALGGFDERLSACADWEMWMRIAAEGAIGYIHEPYLLYRIHSDSDTRRLAATARNIAEAARAIRLGVARLPPQRRRTARAAAAARFADYANQWRRRFHDEGEHGSALSHALWGFRLRPSPGSLVRMIGAAVAVVLHGRSRGRRTTSQAGVRAP